MTREEWLLKRTFVLPDPDPAALAARRAALRQRVSVVLPGRDVEATVGAVCAAIRAEWMDGVPLVDELVVMDGGSRDATAAVAAAAGARVVADAAVLPGVPGAGKGAAMWRSLAVTSGDLVVWLDADIADFDPMFVPRLLTPLLSDPSIGYVKGFYERPLGERSDGGGRVTEICARPLIGRFAPALAGFVQPLSGEAAGRRSLLEHVPFFSGYAVEIGLLLDILRRGGLDAMAQSDLGTRRHTNQPVHALGRMAAEITEAVLRRAGQADAAPLPAVYARPIPRAGGYVLERSPLAVTELPPMASIPPGERR